MYVYTKALIIIIFIAIIIIIIIIIYYFYTGTINYDVFASLIINNNTFFPALKGYVPRDSLDPGSGGPTAPVVDDGKGTTNSPYWYILTILVLLISTIMVVIMVYQYKRGRGHSSDPSSSPSSSVHYQSIGGGSSSGLLAPIPVRASPSHSLLPGHRRVNYNYQQTGTLDI